MKSLIFADDMSTHLRVIPPLACGHIHIYTHSRVHTRTLAHTVNYPLTSKGSSVSLPIRQRINLIYLLDEEA